MFAVDASGRTVGTTGWSAEPTDVEALAPLDDDEVWVGDIGDNTGVARLGLRGAGAGRRGRTSTPGSRRTSSSTPTAPGTPSPCWRTRSPAASTSPARRSSAASSTRRPPSSTRRGPNRLREVGEVLPIATDAAFFPDGRHLVVRSYDRARIYGFPSLEPVADLDLPQQEQGEGVAVTAEGDLLVSTEGQHTDVLRVPLPESVRDVVVPPPPTPSAQPSPSASASDRPDTASREGEELPETTETARAARGPGSSAASSGWG